MVNLQRSAPAGTMTYFERMRAAETALTAPSKHSRPGDAMGSSFKPFLSLQSSTWATPARAETFLPKSVATSWSTANLDAKPERNEDQSVAAHSTTARDVSAVDVPQQDPMDVSTWTPVPVPLSIPRPSSPGKRMLSSASVPHDKRLKTEYEQGNSIAVDNRLQDIAKFEEAAKTTAIDLDDSRAQLASLSVELKQYLTLTISKVKDIELCLENVQKLLRKSDEPPSTLQTGRPPQSAQPVSPPVKVEEPQEAPCKSSELDIKIQLLNGSIKPLCADSKMTVGMLLDTVTKGIGLGPHSCTLLHDGEPLSLRWRLTDCGVETGDLLVLES